jgi:dinuclear metal center YbgI/SA1388 family protein
MDTSIKIKDVTRYLEEWAPLSYQESYDNSGLITGQQSDVVKGVLISLDCTEAVIDEAIQTGCNLVIAHHPIVFKGLKKFTGSSYVERTIVKAIKNDVAIYAIHTNLDNVHTGVNQKICEKIGLKDLKVLAPKDDQLNKLVTFVPKKDTEKVTSALYEAGAGQVGDYKNCSFQLEGVGTFLPTDSTNPHIGERNKQTYVEETRVELLFPSHLKTPILKALKNAHPYEEVAYYVFPLLNENQHVGSGMIGKVEKPEEPLQFLKSLKDKMNLPVIRHTLPLDKKVEKVAVCGGAGSFLLPNAIHAGADVFITADFKYHQFFDADNRIMIADIGHYESEVFTKELLMDVLIKKFHTFAINFSKTGTNPISYI